MATTFPSIEAAAGGGDIAFPADHDKQRIGCKISREALQDSFGDPHGDAMTVFRANRHAIEEKASALIARGRFESDGTVFIRTADF